MFFILMFRNGSRSNEVELVLSARVPLIGNVSLCPLANRSPRFDQPYPIKRSYLNYLIGI